MPNENLALILENEIAQTRTWRPNQSLHPCLRQAGAGGGQKLTELAVDDFAARQYAENDMINRYVRGMNYMELTVRRRSLAPVRWLANKIL